MNINLRKLRIKLKHLAEESRIIRREARKTQGWERYDLNHHRTWDVRNEARATHLAYQFLRGKHAYRDLEGPATDIYFRERYIDSRVRDMVKKYGNGHIPLKLEGWLTGKVDPASESEGSPPLSAQG